MDETQNWPARLSPPQRNNFFFGKMMGVAQFDREQHYGIGQRWLLNRLTIGTGVLCGLEVTLTADGKRLRITPGVAVDPWGREIVVGQPVYYDPFAAGSGCGCGDGAPITEAKDYMLCLTYRECMANDQPVLYADDCPGQPDCQPDTTVETYGLGLSAVETPKPFDCGAWTAAVPAPTDTPVRAIDPGAIGDPGGPAPPIDDLMPVRPAAAAASSPPSIDVLRARLAEQLGASCLAPATTCVPLALVTAKRAEDAWSLTIADGPRRRIYTQAEMLEMILCVARCCGGHHDEPPPTSDTLRVTGIEFMRITGGGLQTSFPRRLEVVSPRQPGAYPPVFDVRPSSTGGADAGPWGPIVLRISFNKAIEGSGVTLLPPLPSQPLGYTVMVAPLDTPGGQEVEARAINSLLEDANSVVMICPGVPGAYRLVMRGDPVAATDPTAGSDLPAITTWDPDPTKRRRLNGEVARPPRFPSGDDGEGGNFEYSYELRPPPDIDTFRIERIFLQGVNERLELRNRTGTTFPVSFQVDRFQIIFSAPVDLNSARAGVTVTRGVNAVTGRLDLDPNDPKSIIFVHREGDLQTPFALGKYEVTVSAGTIKEVPTPGAAARSLAGTPHSPDPPLPSGGGPGADDFAFDFTVAP